MNGFPPPICINDPWNDYGNKPYEEWPSSLIGLSYPETFEHLSSESAFSSLVENPSECISEHDAPSSFPQQPALNLGAATQSQTDDTPKRSFETFNQSNHEPSTWPPVKLYKVFKNEESFPSVSNVVSSSTVNAIPSKADFPSAIPVRTYQVIQQRTYSSLPSQLLNQNQFVIPPPTYHKPPQTFPNTVTVVNEASNTSVSVNSPPLTLPAVKDNSQPLPKIENKASLTPEEKKERKRASAAAWRQRKEDKVLQLERENQELRKNFDGQAQLQRGNASLQMALQQQSYKIAELEQKNSSLQHENTLLLKYVKQTQNINEKVLSVTERVLDLYKT